MKVLVATCPTDDYLTAVLWDGLQEVLGWENVHEAGFTPALHEYSMTRSSSWYVGGYRVGHCLEHERRDYDLLVLHSCLVSGMGRAGGWDWAGRLRGHLRSGGKVVVVDGSDAWSEEEFPPFPVDAYFRREIRPGHAYPMTPLPLTFAMPSRWLDPPGPETCRYFDVFFAGNYRSDPLRWEMASLVYRTARKHTSLIGTGAAGGFREHMEYLRRSKLALCPPGGGGSDCLRFWEAAAAGAIPVFVGLPDKVRDPWFPEGTAFWCHGVETLPEVLDVILDRDLSQVRANLYDHARTHHTTRARALKVLETVGLS